MTGSEVANTSDYGDYETGLEDFDGSRMTMPRLSIVHPDGTFKNSQTGEIFKSLNGIALGMIRQRSMFHKEMGKDKLGPQCKSSDAQTGYPTTKGSSKELFPWAQAGFSPDDLDKDEYGRPMINCSACPFAQWSKDRKPPLCSERHSYPMMFSDKDDFKPGDDMPYSGIVSFQKTGIKPSTQFLAGFKTSKTPVYGAFAHFALKREQVGTVTYSVPVVRRGDATDKSNWREYSEQYAALRDVLRQPPRPPDDAEESAPTAASRPASASSVIDAAAIVEPVSSPATSSFDEDDLPF